MTTATAPKYTAGQRVEVFVTDFEVPGFPEVWKSGTVDRVEVMGSGRHWNVFVMRDDGKWSPQIVGPRGGNKRIRAL